MLEFDGSTLTLRKSISVEGTNQNVWSYRVGSYEVCRKWLKDRRGRTLSKIEIARYVKITHALSETVGLMEQVDCTIDEHGGWPEAFV